MKAGDGMKKTFIFLFLAVFFLMSGSWLIFTQKGKNYFESEPIQPLKMKEFTAFILQDVKVVVLGDVLTADVGDSTEKGGDIN
jgi:hypothetical protein